jgi:endonuclease/exonuclease/phosphatase family metal-dependent hydrolase
MNRGQLDGKLTLLQYNVNKSRKKVLIGLFQEPLIQEIDFLAIQEPWRNTQTLKGYNTQSNFYLIEEEALNTRVSTYINRRIPIDEWSEIYKSKDLISILLQLGTKKVYIHNIYLSPSAHANLELPRTLGKLEELLELEGDYIALGDFNLHYPLWNPITNGHHAIADTLLEITANRGLELLLPKGTITREVQRGLYHEKSTLDLIFSTIPNLEGCDIDWGLEQASDHYPIRTTLLIPQKETTNRIPRRNWKALDLEKFLEALGQQSSALEALLPLNTRESIDLYIEVLIRAIKRAIEASTPLKKQSPFNKPFWTSECRESVKETRYLRRIYTTNPNEVNWLNFTKQRNLKGKTLSKAKQAYYRDALNKTPKSEL